VPALDQPSAEVPLPQGAAAAPDVCRPAAGESGRLAVADVASFLRRQAWLILGLPLLVAILSVGVARPRPATYQAHLAFAVDIPRSAIVIGSDEGTAAKIGEALIDDVSRMIGGDVFAAAVAARLPAGTNVSAGEIRSSLSATDRHRIADVTVTRALGHGATDAEVAALEADLLAVARGVVAELEANGGAWFARLGDDEVVLTIVDTPKVAVEPPSLRDRLELPLRVALALVVALGLAVLVQAADRSIRTESQAVACAAAPVMGRIPRPARKRWLPG